MIKKYLLPPKFQEKIEACLQKLGYSLGEPKKLAQVILRLSDHYQQQTQQTPWGDNASVAASVAYFFPLNYIRNCKVFDEIQKTQFPLDAPYSRVCAAQDGDHVVLTSC